MSTRKKIYLMALAVILMSCAMLTLWILAPHRIVAGLCLAGSLFACMIALAGLKKLYGLHFNVENRTKFEEIYKYDLLGQSCILIFSLVFSFFSVSNFKQIAFSPVKSNQVEVLLSNTSDQKLDEIHLKLGTFARQLKDFSPRQQESFTVPLALASTLLIELKHQGQTRKATLLVQPSDHQVLLRLDYNQNILPELH